MGNPLISVLCPTYNRGVAIESTIASVLSQTEQSWELIVVSDGCTDDTEAVVNEVARTDPRVSLHRCATRYGHPSGPCNEGAARAQGRWHTYLAHDDHWQPDHLSKLARAMDSGTPLAYSRATRELADGTTLGTSEALSQLWHPTLQLFGVLFEPLRAMWVPKVVADVGGWRETAAGLEDWDLWLRLVDAGHRFQPVDAITARITEDPSTRKHSLPCPHDVPLARFDDLRAARRAWITLTDQRRVAGFLDSYRADIRGLFQSLQASGELMAPTGWNVTGRLTDELVDQVVDAEDRVWESLRLRADGDTWVLGSVVATQTAEHAARIAEGTRHHLPRLTELMAGSLDGVIPDPDAVLAEPQLSGAST